MRQIEIENCDLKIFLHDTIESVFEEYFRCPVEEMNGMGGFDQNGKEYELSAQEIFDNVKTCGCWGFVNDKRDIHFWFRPDVDKRELVRFFAHEKGHTMKPYHRDDMKEEMKAGRYEDAAIFGYDVATQLLAPPANREEGGL